MNHSENQTNSEKTGLSGQKVAKQIRPRSRVESPLDLDHWQSRVFKARVTRSGQTHETSGYYVRIQSRGHRENFALHTTDREAAAVNARKIYLSILANGWTQTVAEHKTNLIESADDPTLGEYIELVRATCTLGAITLENYARKLRTITAAIKGMKRLGPDANKYDCRGQRGGRKAWVTAVNRIPIRCLTDEAVLRWRTNYLRSRAGDAIKTERARHTVDSMIRNCKCLFASKLVKKLGVAIKLPDPVPFRSIEPITKGLITFRYFSEIDPLKLLDDAEQELKADHPEQFMIVLLALGAGLRRKEIDGLRWSSVLKETNKIRIVNHEFFSAKSRYSQADVSVEPELIEELLALRTPDAGEYVIASRNKPRWVSTYQYYRANEHFAGACTWLRGKGIKKGNPLHTLRKEYGRLIVEGYGIYAASRALRHSNVQVTAAHYADDTRWIVPGIFKRQPINVTPMPQQTVKPTDVRAG